MSSRKGIVRLGVAAVCALLATSVFADNRGVSFTGIGFIPNPGPRPASMVLSMNPEGTVFVASPTSNASYAVLWTRDGGWGTQIGSVTGFTCLSSGGAVMSNGIFPG